MSKKNETHQANVPVKVEPKELETVQATNAIEIAKCFHRFALHVPSTALKDDKSIVAFGKGLGQLHDFVGWYIGDYALALERKLGVDRANLLTSYAFENRVSPKTVANYKWTASAYSEQDRESIYELFKETKKDCPFSLFVEMASYPQSERLKAFAMRVKLNLSKEQFRDLKNEIKLEKRDDGTSIVANSSHVEGMFKRLETVNNATGTAKEVAHKIAVAIKPVEVEAVKLSPEQLAEVEEAQENLGVLKVELDEAETALAEAETKEEKEEAKENIAEIKESIREAEIELQQARTRLVTVPSTATVNPQTPLVDHGAWLGKIKRVEADNIRGLAKRMRDELGDAETQITRLSNLKAQSVSECFNVIPVWRNNMKETITKLVGHLNNVYRQIDELGDTIATASSVHDAHAIKASEKVTLPLVEQEAAVKEARKQARKAS